MLLLLFPFVTPEFVANAWLLAIWKFVLVVTVAFVPATGPTGLLLRVEFGESNSLAMEPNAADLLLVVAATK